MAFASTDLSVLAYANGFTLWHYLTTDGHTVVDTSGYFDAAAPVLRPTPAQGPARRPASWSSPTTTAPPSTSPT